ncbi:SH3 domain-containing protein [Thermodesulfobacteriota bacterium]
MRKIIIFVLFVLFMSALSFPPNVTAAVMFSTPVKGVITEQGVNVKKGPDLKEKTLCRISEKGTSVHVLGKTGDWFKVKVGPCEGWIQSAYMDVEKDAPSPAAAEVQPAATAEGPADQDTGDAFVPFPTPQQGVITEKKVNIRKGPDSGEKILCRIYVPDEYVSKKPVKVLGRQGEWFKVKFGTCLGWIKKESVSLDRITPVSDQKIATSAAAKEAAAASQAEEERQAALKKQKEEEALRKQKEEAERQEALRKQKEEAERQEALREQKAAEERQAALQRQKAEAEKQASADRQFLYPAPKQGVLTQKKVNIRKGPDDKEKILCRIFVPPEFVNEKAVSVLGRQGDWYKVKFGSCLGWIQKDYIALKAVTPTPKKEMVAAAEPVEKPAETEVVKPEKVAEATEKPEKTTKPRFAESSVLFLPPEEGADEDRRISLKKGPSSNEKTLCQIYIPAPYVKDTWVTVTDQKGDWYEVKMGSCQGWIEGTYLALSREKPEPVRKAEPSAEEQEKMLALQKEKEAQEAKAAAERREALRRQQEEAERREALRRQEEEKKKLAAVKSFVLFPEPQKGTVTGEKVNVKEGRDSTGKTLCRVTGKGKSMTVLGRQGGWYKVKVGRCEGWVQTDYLALEAVTPAVEEKMLAAADAEAAEQEEAARQEALRKQKEEEARQEALRKQQEEAARQEALRKQEEAEAARQAALQKEREEAERQAAEKKKLAVSKALVMFPEPQKGVLTDKKIDLKEGPDVKQKTLCRLPEKGTPVKVLGKKGGWYKVEVQRCIGWVQAAYLTVEEITPAAEKAMIAVAVAEEKAAEPEKKIKEEVLEEEVIEHEAAAEKPEEVVEEEKVAVKEEVKLKKVTTGAMVKEIAFSGNTVIDTETLKELTASFAGRDLTLDEMNAVADLVTMTYQENGYILAKAYLPEQDITKGVLTIAVLEGKIGKIKVEGNTYYKDRVFTRYFRPQMKLGVAKEKYLEKGLLFVKDLPYADSSLVLTQGEEKGTVDVLLNTEDKIAFKLGFDYNNFGSPAVSTNRYGTTIEISDPWWGSRLAYRGVVGENSSDSVLSSIDYFIPLNGYGTQARVGYLRTDYAVGGELADLRLEGFAKIWGGEISHPLMKTRNKNLYLVGGYNRKYTENETVGEVASIDEENSTYVMLKFDNLDRYLGKNIMSLEYHYGHLNEEDRAPISRQFVDTINDRFRGSFARIQKVYGNMNLMLRASGQISDDRLLPIDQVVIGGYGTARGHEPSILLGDSGYTVSGEFMFAPPFIEEKSIFGQRIAQLAQFAFFYDHSAVYQNNIAEGENRSEYLSGYGGGVRLFYKNIFSFRWDIGFPTAMLPGQRRDHINYFQIFLNIF